MRPFRLLPLLVLATLVAHGRNPDDEARAAVQAVEIARQAAFVAGDADLLERLLADDLVYGHADGRVESKADLLEGLRTGAQRYHAIRPGPREVRVLGDIALVFGSAQLLVGPPERTISIAVRFLAVYRLGGTGWQLVAYQSVPLPAG